MLSGLMLGAWDFVYTKNLSRRARRLDLDKAEDNLLAFIKTLASMDDADTVFWWTGHKVDRVFDGLPTQLREFVKARNSRYCTAPESFTRPNKTSRIRFKKILERGGTK